MSYLVLARKYRPQTFAEIVGQEHVTRTLANAFAKGRVHHAFLFCGARGVGKTTAARVLAKALCCASGPTATPCGTCDPCTTITNGTAVDYFEIDGASNNGVDDIRELRDGVRYQPAQLRRKIYVIDEVHMLSVAAFNALLKTLEEPPPHVTFIFATTEVHKIPITILSRCQRYDFKLVPTPLLRAHLEGILTAEQIAVEKGALALLAREAGGSVRDALSLTDQVVAYTGGEPVTELRAAEVLGVADRALLRTLLASVLVGDARGAISAFDAAIARGVDMSHLARSFLAALRDAAIVQSIPDCDGLVDASPEELDALRELTKTVSRSQLVSLFDRFAKACEELRESPSPRLLFEVALLDMASQEPMTPIVELLDRLEQLEGRLRGKLGAVASSSSRSGRGTVAPPAAPRTASQASTPAPHLSAPTPAVSEGTSPGAVASRSPVVPATVVPPAAASISGGALGGPEISAEVASPVEFASAVQADVSAGRSTTPPVQLAAEAPPTAPVPAPSLSSVPVEAAPVATPAAGRSLYRAPAEPLIEWGRLIDAIEERSRKLAGIYHTARLIAWTERAIELGASGAMAADHENVKALEKIIGEITGAPLKIVINDKPAEGASAASARSLLELEAERRETVRQKHEQEARAHPLTEKVMETFGAAIKEIKIDG